MLISVQANRDGSSALLQGLHDRRDDAIQAQEALHRRVLVCSARDHATEVAGHQVRRVAQERVERGTGVRAEDLCGPEN